MVVEPMVTLSFTVNHRDAESLLSLHEILTLESTGPQPDNLFDAECHLEIPSLFRYWLESLRGLGAFDEYGSDWDKHDRHFMDALLQAHDEYFQKKNGPDWQPPKTESAQNDPD